MTILDKIKENANNYPERLAIVNDYLDDCNLTWKQIDTYSDYLANELNGILKTKTPIIVYGHKNPYMIVCFLACVKSGRAYCPIDINVPMDRVISIIDDVNPEVILTTEDLKVDKKVLDLNSIKNIVSKKQTVIDKKYWLKKEDVFYIIFTSGSTGKPKGVQITRDCLDNFITWGTSLISNKKAHYTFINQAPFSFDLSVMDLFLSLYTGGTLWILSKEVQNDMNLLCKSLEKSDANVWVSTPSFADVCLSEPSFSNSLLPNLKEFLFCGEVLTNKTVERLQNRFPKSKIINTYGPTESTVAITDITITEEINSTIKPLPVGKPKKGTWINIVDENNKILPEGEKGEIVIIGDSVSIGYFKNEDLTNKVFGETEIDKNKYRYYKTGDEGYMKEGNLYYCGRIDLQIKLHGYRIEIEDIENNLLGVDGIKQCAVLPKYRDGKVTSLVGLVVDSNSYEDELIESQRIKQELKEKLPEYMVPKKIKFISSMPRTNNGKVDRKALSELL